MSSLNLYYLSIYCFLQSQTKKENKKIENIDTPNSLFGLNTENSLPNESDFFLAKVQRWPLKDGNWLIISRVKALQ